MKPDKTDVNKLLSMDDGKLRQAVSEIAKAIGADDKKAAELSSDIPGLKAKISRMDDAEMQRLIDAVGKEKAQKIIDALQGR